LKNGRLRKEGDGRYEDMGVDEEHESPARTITEADVVNFSAFSGDWSPVHSDEEFCRKTPFKTRIAHGLGLALTRAGFDPAFATARYMARSAGTTVHGMILMGDTSG
jgi:acyl dehydratase